MGFRAPSMESCSSGEEVLVKARKPYTITKQRERWTEEEHNRFLKALRLYGRAWQRIEEHIGTKTAIQIRSHAQKFFSKIEKEALAKGISPGQTLDIDIPPPRPKRKPSNPYPRKTGANISSSIKEGKHDQTLTASHFSCPNEALDLEKGPDETLARTETQENAARSHGNGVSAEVFPFFSDAPQPSVSAQTCPGNPLVFKEFVPMPQKGKKGKTAMNKIGSAAAKENGKYSSGGDVNICRLEGLHIDSQVRAAPLEGLDKLRQTEKVERSSADLETVPTPQEHVSKHPLEEVKEEGEQVSHSDPKIAPAANQQSAQANTNTLRHPSISSASEHDAGSSFSFIHQLPSFPPFCLPHGQDAYRSLCNVSSTFSNLIVTALMQNPAAHAAATLAASFWHPHDSDKSKNPIMETLNGMIPGHMNPHPSMTAIAASTVAAATAWWAMHGLLPLCHPPFPPGFPFVSAATTTSPIMSTKQDVEESKERKDSSPQLPQQDKHMLNSVSPEQVMLRRSASKSAPSSDSDESRGLQRLNETTLKSSLVSEPASTPEVTFYNEKDIIRSRKRKEDHSHDTSEHCSSEAACTIQENPEGKFELEESPVSHDSVVENGFGRYRSSVTCVNESRKEVSEEGRLAFQALFSREELPQSFSPRLAVDSTAQESNERGAPTLSVDLNCNAHACTTEPNHVSAPDDVSLRNNDQLDKFVSACEMGNLKPRARRMGFKPYKRCSMEANAGRVNSDEEKGSKRLHMEGKASNL